MKRHGGCLPAHVLGQYLHGGLPHAEVERVEGHLQECAGCLDVLSHRAAETPFFRAAAVCRQHAEDWAAADQLAALKARAKALRPAPTPAPARASAETSSALGPSDLFRAPSTIDLGAPWEAPLELGRLDKYRILEKIGRGGMGVVYRAEDPDLKRQVAVKIMQPRLAADPTARARFLGEARRAAAVEQHPHIVPIYHVSTAGDVPYFVMPLLRGQALDRRLRDGPPLPPAEVVRIGRDVALGLAAAHAAGLIHRDIKPSNLWLEEGPRAVVKILDFGLARQAEIPTEAGEPLTLPGALMGTPEYLSPEQARGYVVDCRTDLYRLGVVLYQLATGRLPFLARSAAGYLVAHATATPPDVRQLNRAVSPELAAVIHRLLEKDPARRPASAQALVHLLERLPAAQAPKPRPAFTTPWRFAAAGALLAALVLGATAWLNRDRDVGPAGTERPPEQAGSRHAAVGVKPLQVMHYARQIDMNDRTVDVPRGLLGEFSSEVRSEDSVKITWELTAPAFCYLLAFNTDGKEQLLWPVGADLRPDEGVAPPRQERMEYPARPGKLFALDDKPGFGWQAFVAVVSAEPLPPYRDWKATRGPAAWEQLPAGTGVWSSDGAGQYPMNAGRVERGQERDAAGGPPLTGLCRSLRQGRPGLVVEALAFPVRPKE